MKILHLTLKKKWFDMIASGEKKEEYREVKYHWVIRLLENVKMPDGSVSFVNGLEVFKKYDAVKFTNGYSKTAPTIVVKIIGMSISFGNPSWGAEQDRKYFVIKLGNIITQ